jgi:hypothetical protein
MTEKSYRQPAASLPILLAGFTEIVRMERDRTLFYLDILTWALFFSAVTLGLLPP